MAEDTTSRTSEIQKAMAEDTIAHFSHPAHKLVKRHYTGPFLCDMCWESLSGPVYGCRDVVCNFAIHDSCAGHPRTLSSPAHHPHQLELTQTHRDVTYTCDVCAGDCAPGCFLYQCPPCGFDMHPRCAQLPPVVYSTRHQEHDLALVAGEGRCAACRRGAGAGQRAWFYRCDVCNLDLHASCAATHDDEPRHDSVGVDELVSNQMMMDQARITNQMMMDQARISAQMMMDAGKSLSNLAGGAQWRILP